MKNFFLPRPKRRRRPRKPRPSIRFSPSAWAKLLFLRDRGLTEIGGFGITSDDDPLLVTDIAVPRQTCGYAHVDFQDEAVADLFDQQVDRGRRPEQFARIWVHTHPGSSPYPSGVDEETFERVFGACDWAVMFILAKGGHSYARLRFRAGPGGAIRLETKVDYAHPFAGSDPKGWEQEYVASIQTSDPMPAPQSDHPLSFEFPDFEAELLDAHRHGNFFL